jgi:ProP effector
MDKIMDETLSPSPQTDQDIQKPNDQELSDQQASQIIKTQQAREKRGLALTWLCERFPKCFSLISPMPLKIGITGDIENVLFEEANCPSLKDIKSALRIYTHTLKYYNCLINVRHRVDLNGEPTEDVNEDSIQYAKKLRKVRFPFVPKKKMKETQSTPEPEALAESPSVS